MTRLRLLSACAASAMMTALAMPAYAQDADSATQMPEEQNHEIVVVAQGRAQVLSEVPLAVSAVSSESLELTGATDIRSLNQVAPSLLVSSTGNESNASARIRGVGTVGDNPGLESSVATFIDGVYRSRTGLGLNDIGEIERVEILRGPQGTLFGRNASAGLLNIVTKGPSFTLGGMGEVTYGNYDYLRMQGAITGPITDTLAARVDALYVTRDGFIHDIYNDDRINNRDRYLVRGQLLFEPSSDLSVRLIADYSHRNEDCCAAVYAFPEISQANIGLITPTSQIAQILTGITGTTFNQYFPNANDPYSREVALTPGRGYGGTTEDYGFSAQIDYDFSDMHLTSITAYRVYNAYQASDADYGLADILYFGPGTGREFRTFSQELRLQGKAFDDHLDWLVGGYYGHEKLNTISQLRFGSDYGRFATCRVAMSAFGSISPNDPGCLAPSMLAGLQAGVVPGIGALGPVVAGGFLTLDQVNDVGDADSVFHQTSENFAFFTHNIVHLTDRLDFTLGVRYTNETKTVDGAFNNTNTMCGAEQSLLLPYMSYSPALFGGLIGLACQGASSSGVNALSLHDQRRERQFTGTAVLSYRPTDGLMVYASFSHGYKAGGYNLDRTALISPDPTQPLPYFPIDPSLADGYVNSLEFSQESVDAYEIGLKYSSRQFNLNVAAFRQEFSNFQLNTFNGTVYVVQNINGCSTDLGGLDRDTSSTTGSCNPDDIKPGLVSQGIEIEAQMFPADDIVASFGVTYADTRYADNLVGSDDGTPLDAALRELPGQRMSNAPEWTVTGSIGWTPPIGNTGLEGLFYIDARMVDNYNTGSDLFPQKVQDSYVVVNARTGIRNIAGHFSIELWAQNLFNQNYAQVLFNSSFQAVSTTPTAGYPGGSQIFSAYLSEPRTYGITLRGRF